MRRLLWLFVVAAVGSIVIAAGSPARAADAVPWDGEWEIWESLDGGTYSLTLAALDTDLATFEGDLPLWAEALRGRCDPAGPFFSATEDLTAGPDSAALACKISQSALASYAPNGPQVEIVVAGSVHLLRDPEIPAADWIYNTLGLYRSDPSTATAGGYALSPRTYAGEPTFEGVFTSDYELQLTCQAGPCLGGAASGTPPPGSDGSPLVFVFGGATAVALAAAGFAAWARRRRATGTPEDGKTPEEPEQVIVQVSAERLEVSTSRAATLTVTGWLVKPPGEPRRGDVALGVEVPERSGLVVSPATGRGQLVAEVELGALPEEDEALLTVHGAYGTAQGETHVTVSMKVDYELHLF